VKGEYASRLGAVTGVPMSEVPLLLWAPHVLASVYALRAQIPTHKFGHVSRLGAVTGVPMSEVPQTPIYIVVCDEEHG